MIIFDGSWGEPRINGGPRIAPGVIERPQEPVTLSVPMMSTESGYFLPGPGTETSYAGMAWYISGDSGFTNMGAGVLSYVREWVRKPSAFEHFETNSLTFPGIIGSRDPIAMAITTKVAVTFYLIQPGPGGDHASAGDIPIDDEARVEYSDGYTAPLFSSIYVNATSTPSRDAYQAAISAGGYDFVSDPTQLSQVRGPLWRAETRRTQAK